MSVGLTPQMARCLSAIRTLTRGGVPPSYAELQHHLGLTSLSHVSRLLSALKERGHVDFVVGRARSIRIIDQAPDLSKLSLAALWKLESELKAEIGARLQGRGN